MSMTAFELAGNMVAGARIRRAETVSLLRDLVRINSVNPFEGQGKAEAEIAEFMMGKLKSYGLDVNLENVKGKRANVVAKLKGSVDGPTLMLNGHIDTIGTTEMTQDPFSGAIDKDGRLHGRGACDMKGSIASMMVAIKSLVESGSKLRGNVIFTGVIDEEYLSIGTRAIIKEHSSDAAIVGEPTSLNVAIAQKGYAWISVNVKGKAAHGSVPEKGIDAIAKASKLVSRLSTLKEGYASTEHPLLGSPKIHMSTIEGGTEWSVVPESCLVRLERRILPGEPKHVAMSEVQKVVDDLSAEDPEFHATVTKFFQQPAMEITRTEPIVSAVSAAYKKVMRRRATITGVPYWTDAALLVSEAGIPTCIFGPGDIRQAHSADEYVSLEEVEKAALIFERAIINFCRP